MKRPTSPFLTEKIKISTSCLKIIIQVKFKVFLNHGSRAVIANENILEFIDGYFLLYRRSIDYIHATHEARKTTVRKAEMTTKLLQGKECQGVVGFDANALYLWAIKNRRILNK